MHESLEAAIDDFRKKCQREHDAAHDGIEVTVSNPVEVTKEEVDRHNPSWGALVQRITAVVKNAIARSIDPIDITWGWEWIDDAGAEALVRLRLAAEAESATGEFTREELQDESVMRVRILRLYDELLQKLLEKQLGPIRESILEHRGA
jgi:hypothetical protein